MTQISQTRQKLRNLSLSAVLIAFGILIPMIMPIKLIIGPASYTLASHLPIFLGIFISAPVAIAVTLGTALGFFLAGFPFVIVMRAFSHIVFTLLAVFWYQKQPHLLTKPKAVFSFALIINSVHALAEFLVVLILTSPAQISGNYWLTLFMLIGVGTLIHGLIDFYLALYCWKMLPQK